MDSSSFFWANFGVLEKIGIWTPFYNKSVDYGTRKQFYDIYQALIVAFTSIHTFVEIVMLTCGFRELEIDELTVSVAYGIQHFLGIAKVYIMTSRKHEIMELDQRTKIKPFYRKNDPKFLRDLEQTIKWSDMLGYVYWFAVLTTISCGCATGIYVTLTNKSAMITSCHEKYQFYKDFIANNGIDVEQVPWIIGNSSIFPHSTFEGQAEIKDLAWRIENLEQKISENGLNVPNGDVRMCKRPKRVFPYHIWLPFGKYTRYYEIIFVLNFLAGFCLVCIILPIDLLVMSFMRYIRLQFHVISDDLINLRDDVLLKLQDANGKNPGESIISLHINNRLIDIANHHIEVCDFFYRANDLFTWALFAQYLGSGAMICGVLFSISSVADHVMTPKFFHVAFFYSGLIIQLYSNCFYGSQVFVASEDIQQHAYFSNWQASGRYSPQIRNALSMVMMRSKRACRLMAGKFAAVDLPTFLAVVKASYTYYTVLIDEEP